ncbi:MAG: hypothetical protein OXB92_10895 [Acidimicrobiaceae bacterium]|nr:hypothetical protein [Acidimicrobiia bacterium]MCY4494351.1 hypothetical protein [Acidimicrobiaceae bacterium]
MLAVREILAAVASPTAERVFLRIPARRPYAQIVRTAAAALATRLGMSFVAIDDLGLAVDQAMVMLLDGLDGLDGSEPGLGAGGAASPQPDHGIDVVFRIAESRFEFEASRSITSRVSQQAVQLLNGSAADLVDELRIDGDIGTVWLTKSLPDVR